MTTKAIDQGTIVWSREDSNALDEWAERNYRNPLQRNNRLWELLAPDREQAPRAGSKAKCPSHCTDCREPLRTHRDPPAPGTVLHRGRGLCGTCHRHRISSGIPLPDRISHTAPLECRKCKTPLRTQRNVNDGRKIHAGLGMCNACYREHKRGGRKRMKRPDNCIECGVPVRKSTVLKADAPGTARYHGEGMCRKCFDRKDSQNGLRKPAA